MLKRYVLVLHKNHYPLTQEYITPLRRFFRFVRLERKEIFNIYFYATLSGIIYLSLPLGIQAIINLLFGGLISTSIAVLITVVVLGVAGNGWLQILQMKVNERIQRKIFTRFALQFAHKIPKLDLVAVDNYYLPELVNRFFDTASLQKGMSKVLLDFPSATVQIIFGLMLLSFYNTAFIIYGFGIIILVLLILRFTYPKGMSTSIKESDYKYEVGYWLEEVARSVKTFKFMPNRDFTVLKADKLVSGYLDARSDHFDVLVRQYWSFVGFKLVITASLLIIGSILVIDQQINLGQFIASEIVIILILNSVEKMISSLDVVYDMLTSLEKVSVMLDKPDERTDGIITIDKNKTTSIEIEARNLSFRFNDSDKWILNNLNFHIQSGERVCLFGSQGSGKSALLNILTGAYPNISGNLLFNKYPLGNYNLPLLRKHIGVFLNGNFIFSGSVKENLTLGNPDISNEQILKTATLTGLIGYIQSLPQGISSKIDTLGRKLPRNTINKILLTRAMLGDPSLMLIEDCWSGLEIAEQDIIINALTDPSRKFTLVAVTNDEKFAARCDRVILLEKGEILAQGTFDEVSRTPHYSKLFKRFSL